jgi:zinc protease
MKERTGGWTLLAERDALSLLARVQIIVRAGSVSDPAGLPGLAHFTGRALMRGTRTRPYPDLVREIELLGGSIAIGTDQTRTVINAVVLARNLDPLLDLLADVVTSPAFDTVEMDRLRSILSGEVQMDFQDVRAVGAIASRALAYAGTPAARHPRGSLEGLARITGADAAGHFEKSFVRENMTLAIVSPLEPERASELLESKLASVRSGAAASMPLPRATFRGRTAAVVPRGGMATVPLYVLVPGLADGDPDLPELEVANFSFGADFTARLMQVLRAEKGWTYGAYSDFHQLFSPGPEATVFSLYTYPSAEFAALAIPRAFELLEEFSRDGLSEDEFRSAREAMSQRYPFEIDTAEKRLALRLRQILHGRPLESAEEYSRRLSRLTHSTLNERVRRRLRTEDAVIVAVGDPVALKPVLAALPGVRSVQTIDVQP